MQQVQVQPYVKQKRDEMTFGYLPDHVLPNIVPDMTGSAKFYDPDEVRNLMMQMDSGFVGMRRSTIDKTNAVRQLILYTMVAKVVDAELRLAVYQRAAGAEAKLKDGFSFGFGGHVEAIDLGPHMNEKEDGSVESFNECPSSYFSTMHSGLREVSEEVHFFNPEHKAVPMQPQEMANEILGHFSFTNVRSEPVVDGTLDDYKASAVFVGENFVLLREEGAPQNGKLIFSKPTGPDQVYREVFGKEPVSTRVNHIDTELLPVGFLSDIKPENPSFIGNTHFAVLGFMLVPDDLEFKVAESNYTTIGWMSKDEIREAAARFEPWSQILVGHLDEIENMAVREEALRLRRIIEQEDAAREQTDELSSDAVLREKHKQGAEEQTTQPV
jgi:predicted NUDIX family phosphoesterase